MSIYDTAMRLAIYQAKIYMGATSPNPPVGATGLDSSGQVLSVQAHEKAGHPHAEVMVIEDCRKRGILDKLHTLVVTLEPCNHQGKTPPCTSMITTGTNIKRVVYGATDPNPKVKGKGAFALKERKIEVIQLENMKKDCEELIESFAHWIKTGFPWVTVKQAINVKGTMIPELGQKTFTSAASLRYAHELRKRADAILTGSGTVLADRPEFTVRHVLDHPGKKRFLAYMDRRNRVPADWVIQAESHGFFPMRGVELPEVLQSLGKNSVMEVLVEAGPTLTQAVLSTQLWNSHVVIRQIEVAPGEIKDQIEITKNVHWNHRENRKSNPPRSR